MGWGEGGGIPQLWVVFEVAEGVVVDEAEETVDDVNDTVRDGDVCEDHLALGALVAYVHCDIGTATNAILSCL